jgi:hypothetical protein
MILAWALLETLRRQLNGTVRQQTVPLVSVCGWIEFRLSAGTVQQLMQVTQKLSVTLALVTIAAKESQKIVQKHCAGT